MWQDKNYQFITLFIYLFEDHLVWDEVGFAGRQVTLYYTDIISVSGGNAGRHLGGTSRLEINTAGQTYKYSSTLGAFEGLEECIPIINERIQYYRNNKTGSTNPASFTNTININPDNIEPTITRIDLFLEDGEWERVRGYANAALDYFPTDYRLYKYLLLADLQRKSIDELKNSAASFASNSNYKKLDRYADESLKNELKDILEYIEKEPIYKQAKETADTRQAIELFKKIRGYKDSIDYVSSLQARIEEEEIQKKEREEQDKESKYQVAIQLQYRAETIEDCKKAIETFTEIKASNYKDSGERVADIQKKLGALEKEEKYSEALNYLNKGDASSARKAKGYFLELESANYKNCTDEIKSAQIIIDKAANERKKKLIIVACIVAVAIAAVASISINQQNKKNIERYEQAIELYNTGTYNEALDIFNSLGNYEDARAYAEKCSEILEQQVEAQAIYDEAIDDYIYGRFEDAKNKLSKLGEFSDCRDKVQEIKECEEKIERAKSLIREGNLCEAKVFISDLPELLDESVTENMQDLIWKYGNYAGKFTTDPGDKPTATASSGNAITHGGKDIKEIHVKVLGLDPDKDEHKQYPYLLIEYDGGSIELKERESVTDNPNMLRYSNYEDDYYVQDSWVDNHKDYSGGEAIEIEDRLGGVLGIDRYKTQYYRKDEANNAYR